MSDAPVDHCWTRIGIGGDGSCPELAAVIHCRNCAVYARAGRQLLEQAPPPGYLDEWAGQLAVADSEVATELLSVVIFRLGSERFALATALFVEIVEQRSVHCIPHRPGAALLGLANIGGELQLCVSLAALLGATAADGSAARPRLAVIEREGDRWVFPVDELVGIERIERHALGAPPATVARDAAAFTTAMFEWRGVPVAILDSDLLFAALHKVVA